MSIKKYIFLALLAIVSASIISGCSGYGKIRLQSRYGDDVTIEKLQENLPDYTIYYAGYAVNNPSGIMFDPKNNDKTLQPSGRWTKLDDKESVIEVISWIKIQDSSYYYPRLYRILGPDDQFYGYLYSAWNHLLTKVVDGKTLWVYDLPDPPHYEYGPDNETKTPGP
ncbi:MAG: hypothetical protein ABIN18_11945 [Pseudomonadota bacterium]